MTTAPPTPAQILAEAVAAAAVHLIHQHAGWHAMQAAQWHAIDAWDLLDQACRVYLAHTHPGLALPPPANA